MAKSKKSMHGTQAPVTDEVRRFLSANGKLGGQTTGRLIALGKERAEEEGIDIQAEIAKRSKKVA